MPRTLLPLLACLCLPTLGTAQTSYPMITHAYPPAVQRGTTTEIVVQGQMGFPGAYRALFEGNGITAEILSPPAPPQANPGMRQQQVNQVRLKLTVAPDAALGVREFRIATKLSLSSIGQLAIVDKPVTLEGNDNNTANKATKLPVPGVVCGRLEAPEDADFYKFHAASGQTLTFEVLCARIQDKIHDLQQHADPVIFLYDAKGRELASSDDYRFADPLLSHRFEQAGEYFLQIRDAKYTGDARWVYVLSASDKPYPAHVYPLAVTAGHSTRVEVIGTGNGAPEQGTVDVPKEMQDGIATLPMQQQAGSPSLQGATSSSPPLQGGAGGVKTPPLTPPSQGGERPEARVVIAEVPIWVTSLPLLEEKEPNDLPANATTLTFPCCVNGRIGTKRDLDHFSFSAKRGQALRFEVRARRFGTELNSLLDSSLDILDAQGRVLASGDDISQAMKDAQVIFTPPQDGTYFLRLRDLHNKGGAQYVYALEAAPVQQDFTVRVDGDKAMLGPGASMPWYVVVQRQGGFTGPVTMTVEGLPDGVTASPLVIPPTMTQGVVVLTAAPSAKMDVRQVRVMASAELVIDGKKQQVTKPAPAEQEIYFPGGGRGRFEVNLQAVAVTESADILKVEVTPSVIRLKPGEEVKISVKLTRSPSAANANVTLDVPLRHLGTLYANPLPPGVVVVENRSKTLLGRGNEGHIVLRALPNAAPVENVPITVVAHVSINFVVKIGYASVPLPVTVAGR
jgi:hypothetical protein